MAATRGHKSAASLATGPVMAEPLVSPFGLTTTPALSVATKWDGDEDRFDAMCGRRWMGLDEEKDEKEVR